jgi:CoA-transferase family III/ATP dependent DNA ligase domain
LKVEGVVNRTVHAEKALGGSSRLEPLQLALASSDCVMRILRPIVLPKTLLMPTGQSQTPERSGVGAQLVGDQQFRRETLLLEQLADPAVGPPECRVGAEPACRGPRPRDGLLKGIRVLDLTQFEAGTTCTEALAWMGADIANVEPTRGEAGRTSFGDAFYFMMYNANKHSLTVNLKEERGLALVKEMAKKADVFTENFVPGAVERLGLARANLAHDPFDDPDWLFDVKYDGFRGLCYIEPGRNRLVSRHGNAFDRFDALADQIAAALDVHDVILDGEIIAADETGRPVFIDLLRGTRALAYVAFDLLWLEMMSTCGNCRYTSGGSGCSPLCRRDHRSYPSRCRLSAAGASCSN